MAVTIATTAASLNRHHIVYEREIAQEIRLEAEFENNMRRVPCEDTYCAPNVEQGELLQAYQGTFTPKNDVTFDEVNWTLESIKIDIQFEPADLDDFRKTWKYEWDQLGGPFRKDYTFPKWLYKNVMMPKIKEELATLSMDGVRVAPTVGTAGNYLDSATGFKKHVLDYTASNDLVPIPTGPILPATAVAQVEDFVEALPLKYRNKKGFIDCSPEVAKLYLYDYRAKYGYAAGVSGNENMSYDIYGTKMRLRPSQELSGMDALLYTPEGNLITGRKIGQAELPAIRWEEDKRMLIGMCEMDRFWGWKYHNTMFINDQWV